MSLTPGMDLPRFDPGAGTRRTLLLEERKRPMATKEIRFPEIEVQLTGEDGNGFAILAAVRKAMRRGGCSKEDWEAFMDEATSGDYDHLLQTCMAWVNVT